MVAVWIKLHLFFTWEALAPLQFATPAASQVPPNTLGRFWPGAQRGAFMGRELLQMHIEMLLWK